MILAKPYGSVQTNIRSEYHTYSVQTVRSAGIGPINKTTSAVTYENDRSMRTIKLKHVSVSPRLPPNIHSILLVR